MCKPDGFPAGIVLDDETSVVPLEEQGARHAEAPRAHGGLEHQHLVSGATDNNFEARAHYTDLGDVVVAPVGIHAGAVPREIDTGDGNARKCSSETRVGELLVEKD